MMAALGTTSFLAIFFFSNLSDGFTNCLSVSVLGDLACVTISFLPGLTITKRLGPSLQDRGSWAVFSGKDLLAQFLLACSGLKEQGCIYSYTD